MYRTFTNRKITPLLLSIVGVLLLIPKVTFAVSIDATIWSVFISLGGIFTWIGGVALDFAINQLVIGMGAFLTTNVGVAVDQMWLVVRDIANIGFIFGLILIGLRTILFTSDNSSRRTLGVLIIAALLINFSLFITKTVVDFSNIAAAQIYDQVQISGTYSAGFGFGAKGIAGAFMDQMQLHTFAGSGSTDSIVKQISQGSGFFEGTAKVFAFGFLMMVLMIIAGVVFLAGAVILIKRFIFLVFYLIFSPLLFVGFIFPKANVKKHWMDFLQHAFIAPAYIFMLYLSLYVTRGLAPKGDFSNAYSANATENGNFDIFVYFLIIAGFLGGSLFVAQKMGSSTAGATLKGLQGAGNTLRGAAQGWAYRNTAGKAIRQVVRGMDAVDRRLADSENRDGNRSRLGRNLRRLTGINALRSTGRFITSEPIRRSVEGASNAGMGGRGLATAETDVRTANQRAARGNQLAAARQKLKGGDVEGALNDLSPEQLLTILKEDSGDDKKIIFDNARLLSSGQVSAIQKEADFNDNYQSEFGGARRKSVIGNIRSVNPTTNAITNNVGKSNKNELEAIGASTLATPEYAVRLNSKQIDDMDATETEKDEIRRNRNVAHETVAGGTPVGGFTRDDLLKQKPNLLAELSDTTLDRLAVDLPISALEAIYRGNTKSNAQQHSIRTKILAIAAPTAEQSRVRDWLDPAPPARSPGQNFGA